MRMPNSKEMSREQRKIYLDAPLDGSILVTGPPGTGKTIIAFLRAQTVSKFEGKSTVAMYNNVLSNYAGNVGDDGYDYEVTTLHKWVNKWWRHINPSYESNEIVDYYLDCPYDEKDEAKKLGARWNRAKSKWYVPGDVYKEHRSKFDRWEPEPVKKKSSRNMPPNMPGDKWQYDWDKILEIIINQCKAESISKANVNWGHLILDEAQDFPPKMFETFDLITKLLFKNDSAEGRPAITVFADENQRLSEKTNSTIKEIKGKLYLPDNRIYSLTKNYRNTLQIARLASEFYTGLSTGKPDLPEVEGDLPLLVNASKLNDTVEYIYRYAVNHDNEEIGVIAQNDKVRKQFVNRLSSKLKGSKRLKLQSYSSIDKDWKDSRKMEFDKGGVITVVNKQSCKGLEFDAVFLPELQSISVAPDDKDQFMMEMYVMISRARHMLALMYSNEGDAKPAILLNIPDKKSGLLEYVNAK